MLLIDEGRVVASGTHAELLATTSLYGEVLARTTLDDEDEAAVGAEQVDG